MHKPCPLCGNPAAHAAPDSGIDSDWVTCPTCRAYCISWDTLYVLEKKPDLKPGVSKWVRCYFEKTGHPYRIREGDELSFPEDCADRKPA